MSLIEGIVRGAERLEELAALCSQEGRRLVTKDRRRAARALDAAETLRQAAADLRRLADDEPTNPRIEPLPKG